MREGVKVEKKNQENTEKPNFSLVSLIKLEEKCKIMYCIKIKYQVSYVSVHLVFIIDHRS